MTTPPPTTLKERITEDMKSAMRAGEKERLGTIRMLQAAIKQREVDERVTLDDALVLAVIEKMLTHDVAARHGECAAIRRPTKLARYFSEL